MSLPDVMLTAALTLMSLAAGAVLGYYLGRTEAPRPPERKPSETRRKCTSTEDFSHDGKEKSNSESKTDAKPLLVERRQSKTRSIQTEEGKHKLEQAGNRQSVATARTNTTTGVTQGEVKRAKSKETTNVGYKEIQRHLTEEMMAIPVLSEFVIVPEKALPFKPKITIPRKIVHAPEKKTETEELTAAPEPQRPASEPSPKPTISSEDMPEEEKGLPKLRIKLKKPTALSESVTPENTTEANTNSASEEKVSATEATEGKEKPRDELLIDLTLKTYTEEEDKGKLFKSESLIFKPIPLIRDHFDQEDASTSDKGTSVPLKKVETLPFLTPGESGLLQSTVPIVPMSPKAQSFLDSKLTALKGPLDFIDTVAAGHKALIAQAGLAEIQDSEKTPLPMTPESPERRETQNKIEHVDSGPQVAQNDVPATWSHWEAQEKPKEPVAEKLEKYEEEVKDVGTKQEPTAMDTTQQAIHPTAEEEPKQKAEEKVAAVAKQLPPTAEKAKESPVVTEESSKKISVSPSKEQQKPRQKTSLNDLRHGFQLKRKSSKQKMKKK